MLRLFQRHLERAQFRVVGVSVVVVRRKVENPFLGKENVHSNEYTQVHKANLSEKHVTDFYRSCFLSRKFQTKR